VVLVADGRVWPELGRKGLLKEVLEVCGCIAVLKLPLGPRNS